MAGHSSPLAKAGSRGYDGANSPYCSTALESNCQPAHSNSLMGLAGQPNDYEAPLCGLSGAEVCGRAGLHSDDQSKRCNDASDGLHFMKEAIWRLSKACGAS